ncbi:MAG: 2Fe-2S iron-sulfur cluster binding domain-containing protein [Vitreoscilla sp.]|jgi:2Fe-2S ferredoxin|nr:2Fe-2S iron-sulfur cluster binding domain-containing protein [Burkholderiales bacterium]MBP6337843.1 2Fe-2S iron-sulfur cluster binding domain-containing protein [Vitreoscilla sp.]MBP6674739.1 2Fe-2S iron-sulfur cluster binding domain-containing protein [Vitreoscilla sp.]
MTTLTIMPANVTVEVAAGTNLLQAILDAGQALVTKCGGKASCGGCHIFLTGGRKGISKMTPEENAKLDTIVGIGSKSRLACQMTILGTEPVTVELLGALSG